MVNRVLLMGRLVKDPELRKTNSDVSFATFTLAVDNRIREADGTRGTIFIDCRVFREQAESLVKNTKSQVQVIENTSILLAWMSVLVRWFLIWDYSIKTKKPSLMSNMKRIKH